MTLAAFLATGISLFCAGFLFGLYVRGGDARRVPEHPSVRAGRLGVHAGLFSVNEARTLRLVEPPPFDQDRERAE